MFLAFSSYNFKLVYCHFLRHNEELAKCKKKYLVFISNILVIKKIKCLYAGPTNKFYKKIQFNFQDYLSPVSFQSSLYVKTSGVIGSITLATFYLLFLLISNTFGLSKYDSSVFRPFWRVTPSVQIFPAV